MDVHVLVTAAGPDEPQPGTPVIVEIRDTSLMDVASTTISAGRAVTGEAERDGLSGARRDDESEGGPDGAGPEPAAGQDVPGRQVLATVDLTVPDDADPRSLTVWARVATSDHEHLTSGDWITVQAYPLQSDTAQSDTVVVEVVKV